MLYVVPTFSTDKCLSDRRGLFDVSLRDVFTKIVTITTTIVEKASNHDKKKIKIMPSETRSRYSPQAHYENNLLFFISMYVIIAGKFRNLIADRPESNARACSYRGTVCTP